jgi:hypothetical protein
MKIVKAALLFVAVQAGSFLSALALFKISDTLKTFIASQSPFPKWVDFIGKVTDSIVLAMVLSFVLTPQNKLFQNRWSSPWRLGFPISAVFFLTALACLSMGYYSGSARLKLVAVMFFLHSWQLVLAYILLKWRVSRQTSAGGV